jgi:hypothetical protein
MRERCSFVRGEPVHDMQGTAREKDGRHWDRLGSGRVQSFEPRRRNSSERAEEEHSSPSTSFSLPPGGAPALPSLSRPSCLLNGGDRPRRGAQVAAAANRKDVRRQEKAGRGDGGCVRLACLPRTHMQSKQPVSPSAQRARPALPPTARQAGRQRSVARREGWVHGAVTHSVCSSPLSACAVRCTRCLRGAQSCCACRTGGAACAAELLGVTEEQWRLVADRMCADGAGRTLDSRVLCRRHADKWLYRYRPASCPVCGGPVQPGQAGRLVPLWLQNETHAPKGALVHDRPC